MKKNLWKISVFAAIVLAIAMGIQACATNTVEAKSNDLTGTWTVHVIPAPDLEIPPFVGLSSMTKEGLLISADDVGLTGLGVWEKASNNTYKVTYEGLFEQDDTKMRYQVRATVELSVDGEHFGGPFINDIYVSGVEEPVFSVNGTVKADRMHVVPLE